jgi:hypothetical protein
LEQPAEDRLLLMRHRERLVKELVTATRIRNLEARLAEAEARLKPRLVVTAMELATWSFRDPDFAFAYFMLLGDDMPERAAVVDRDTGQRCEFRPLDEAATLPIAGDVERLRFRVEAGDAHQDFIMTWPEPEPQHVPKRRRGRPRLAK